MPAAYEWDRLWLDAYVQSLALQIVLAHQPWQACLTTLCCTTSRGLLRIFHTAGFSDLVWGIRAATSLPPASLDMMLGRANGSLMLIICHPEVNSGRKKHALLYSFPIRSTKWVTSKLEHFFLRKQNKCTIGCDTGRDDTQPLSRHA